MTLQKQQHIRQEGYIAASKSYVRAMRYIANAKDTLKKTGRDGIYFKDAKYVSSASGIAYKGALTALEIIESIKPHAGSKNLTQEVL